MWASHITRPLSSFCVRVLVLCVPCQWPEEIHVWWKFLTFNNYFEGIKCLQTDTHTHTISSCENMKTGWDKKETVIPWQIILALNLFAALFPTFKSSLVREDIMTDGIFLVLVSSHFHCSNPSIPPRGPYVFYSFLKECKKRAWRLAN